MFSGFRLTVHQLAFERDQADLFIAVIVNAVRQPTDGSNLDAEFFPDFAHDTHLLRFASVDFASREFPSSGKMSIRSPLRSQYFSFTTYDRTGHVNHS